MTDSKDPFGDRMKEYEAVESARSIDASLPVYIRLDGRSFSRFTKGLPRPYDAKLSYIMKAVAEELTRQFKPDITYTQSDEISLGWFDHGTNEFIFGGRVQKIVTVLAGVASAKFNQLCFQMGGIYKEKALQHCPAFDARIISIDCLNKPQELINMFMWRQKDCERNSVSMAAQAEFSHKSLQNKSTRVLKELLRDIDKPWEDMPEFFKTGTFLRRVTREGKMPDTVPVEFRTDAPVIRSRIIRIRNANQKWDSNQSMTAYWYFRDPSSKYGLSETNE